MKKIIAGLLLTFLLQPLSAQVVFCPPGAEWHYNFWTSFMMNFTNEKIFYLGDTVDSGDTVKILMHNKFYLQCNMVAVNSSYIKQKGDTIFFKNSRTSNTWQILYNFATPVGQSWQTTVLKYDNTPKTTTFMVDSIKFITINGSILKRLFVNGKAITEKIGNDGFLFNFLNYRPACDGDMFWQPLCYSDNTFPTYNFTTWPCDYSPFTAALPEEEAGKLEIFPNPFIDKLRIKPEVKGKYSFEISDIIGRTINHLAIENSILELDLAHFNSGIYFLKVYENGQLIETHKIIKE